MSSPTPAGSRRGMSFALREGWGVPSAARSRRQRLLRRGQRSLQA